MIRLSSLGRVSRGTGCGGPRRRGNAAVEFALAGMLLLVLLMGLMEWGWTLYHWFGLQRASQAGARLAAVTDTASDPELSARAAVEAALRQWGIDPTDVRVDTRLSGETGARVVTVEVTLEEAALIGLLPTPDRSVALASQHYEEVLPPQVEP